MPVYYLCKTIEHAQCTAWEGFSPLFALSTADGLKIGGMFLSLCVFAFIGRTLLTAISRI